MKMTKNFNKLLLFLFALPFSIAGAQPAAKETSDSLKTRIQKEVDIFHIEVNELFTDAPGLKPAIDSAYPHLKLISNKKTILGFRYPLILNESLLIKTMQRNKISLSLKNTSKWKLEGKDSTASKDRYLQLRLIDGEEIAALCDTTYYSKVHRTGEGPEIWRGHVKDHPGSLVYIVIYKNASGIESMTIKIEGLGPSFQEYVSNNRPWFTLREENYAPMLGPEDGVPENNFFK